MIKQQYNLPIGTDLSYWIGVSNTCKRLIDLIIKNIVVECVNL